MAAVHADDVRSDRPEGTREYHRTKARHVARVLGADTPLASLDDEALRRYADTRLAENAHRHSVHKDFIVLRKGARLVGRPIPRERIPDLGTFYKPRDRWLPLAEYRKLLAAIDHDRRDWVIGFTHTGVRWSELHSIEARHVDLDACVLFVEGTKTTKSVRTIPLDDDAIEVFARRAAAHPTGPLFPPYSKKNFRSLMQRATKRAGIVYVGPNDLRRTFASWLANAGVAESTTARFMGNSSQIVRRVYAQMEVTTLHEAVAKLPRVTSKAPTVQAKRA